MLTIEQLKNLKESEHRVEFKRGAGGNVSYDGGTHPMPKRRRCVLGYVTALCNEGGGYLVIGMEDAHPHKVCGTRQNEGSIGILEANIYRDIKIRVKVYELFEDESARTGRVLEIEVPKRPVGRVFKFEDVPLMRIGEELRPMPDEQLLSILQEQEPDFSEQICNGVGIEDLDGHAIEMMRGKYARK